MDDEEFLTDSSDVETDSYSVESDTEEPMRKPLPSNQHTIVEAKEKIEGQTIFVQTKTFQSDSTCILCRNVKALLI